MIFLFSSLVNSYVLLLSPIKGTKDYQVLDFTVVEHLTFHPKVQGKHGRDCLTKAIK